MLEVWKAKQVFVSKRGQGTGYSGIEKSTVLQRQHADVLRRREGLARQPAAEGGLTGRPRTPQWTEGPGDQPGPSCVRHQRPGGAALRRCRAGPQPRVRPLPGHGRTSRRAPFRCRKRSVPASFSQTAASCRGMRRRTTSGSSLPPSNHHGGHGAPEFIELFRGHRRRPAGRTCRRKAAPCPT